MKCLLSISRSALMKGVAAVALCGSLAFSVEAPAENTKIWVCKAEGTYVSCPSSRSWSPCQEFRSYGQGTSNDRTKASIEAEDMCSESMIRMLIMENRNGRSSIKSRCVTITCELKGL